MRNCEEKYQKLQRNKKRNGKHCQDNNKNKLALRMFQKEIWEKLKE